MHSREINQSIGTTVFLLKIGRENNIARALPNF